MICVSFRRNPPAMKSLRIALFLGLLLSIHSSVFSQTKLIAHKSHSGKVKTFTAKAEGNFGLPSHYRLRRLDSLIRISDTLAVAYSSIRETNVVLKDTVRIDDPDYLGELSKMPIDDVKKRYPSIKFIGFEKTSNERPTGRIKDR